MDKGPLFSQRMLRLTDPESFKQICSKTTPDSSTTYLSSRNSSEDCILTRTVSPLMASDGWFSWFKPLLSAITKLSPISYDGFILLLLYEFLTLSRVCRLKQMDIRKTSCLIFY